MNDSVRRCAVAVASLVLLFTFGCATSPQAGSQDVELQIEQLPDAGFAIEDHGAVSIAYQLSVHNRLEDAVTLRKIEMRTMGESPYTLRDAPAEVSETVAAGTESHVSFTLWGYPREQRTNSKKTVWVSGVAYFDRPAGPFRKEFTLSFREP
jgi:hypothetical protein